MRAPENPFKPLDPWNTQRPKNSETSRSPFVRPGTRLRPCHQFGCLGELSAHFATDGAVGHHLRKFYYRV